MKKSENKLEVERHYPARLTDTPTPKVRNINILALYSLLGKYFPKEVYTLLTHGKTKTRLYSIYKNMKQRCYNANNPKYSSYGGRGITICEEWLHDFQKFYDWSMANGYLDELTIDRIDGTKGYSPDNCQWVTWEENRKTSGRPTDNPKIHRIAVKMDNETKNILDAYCEQEKVNQMEAARRGIRKLKEDLK